MSTSLKKLPSHIKVSRGQTQKNVNKTILEELINRYDSKEKLKLLDLPCGNQEFLSYVKALFPESTLHGADILEPYSTGEIQFKQMDLSRNFEIPESEQFDVITSISGVMMFGNTQNFIENCCQRLKPGGLFIVTNDNPATIKDRLSYFLLGRFRIFDQLFEDHETLTQLVIIQDLTRLMRLNSIEIQKVHYTSFYWKDVLMLPFAIIVYPLQALYLLRRKTSLSKKIAFAKYSFKQLLCRHYIITGRKKNNSVIDLNQPNKEFVREGSSVQS